MLLTEALVDVNPQTMGDSAGMRCRTWATSWPLAGPRRLALFTGSAWLIVIAVIVLRFFRASVTIALLVFLVAAMAGFLAGHSAHRVAPAGAAAAVTGLAGPAGEADRMWAALLAAVSHDLRSPLLAATAAVSGLRSPVRVDLSPGLPEVAVSLPAAVRRRYAAPLSRSHR